MEKRARLRYVSREESGLDWNAVVIEIWDPEYGTWDTDTYHECYAREEGGKKEFVSREVLLELYELYNLGYKITGIELNI